MAKWLARNAILVAAYYLSGKAALLLATPAGFAAPLWPGAGIALAALLLFGYRMCPGVLLGAFLVNLDAAFVGVGSAAPFTAFALAASIGTGNALQALVGAFSIRTSIGFPNALTKDRDVIRFLFLGGPASCLIGSSCGVTSMIIAGVSPGQDFFLDWCTWFVGDVIGVLIFTPLLLIWLAPPRKIWRPRWLTVALPLSVTFAAAVVVFLYARLQEEHQTQVEFEQSAEIFAHRIEETLHDYLEAVYSVDSLYASSQEVTREEFHSFDQHLLSRHKGIQKLQGIQALLWIPRVARGDREAYEAAVRAEGFDDFQFTQLGSTGERLPAQPREEYLPAVYVEPYKTNEATLGVDFGSSPPLAEALRSACDLGGAVATKPIKLVQDPDYHAAFLIFKPVYRKGRAARSVAQRRQNLKGYVSGVFRADDIFQPSLQPWVWDHMTMRIVDETGRSPHQVGPLAADGTPMKSMTDGDEVLVYTTNDFAPRATDGLATSPTATKAARLKWTRAIKFAERRWRIEFRPTRAFLVSTRTGQSWWVLAGGLIFTAMLGTFLLIQSGRSAEVENLVLARTAELSHTNNDLEQQIRERRRVEQELSVARAELELRVQERTAELLASQAQYHDLYDNAPDMFATVDVATQRIIQCNSTLLAATGYTREEMIGRKIFDVYDPDCRSDVRRAFALFVEKDQVHTAEFQLCSKDGRRIDVGLNVSSILDEQGRIRHIRSIWRDITERKRAEDKIRQQQAELAHVSRLSTMGEMAAGLAHEINQPLAAIAARAKGAALRLQSGRFERNTLAEVLERISADAHRAGEVIRRLRRFVRKREPQRSSLDINDLVQDVVQFTASDAFHQQVDMQVDLADDLPCVRGDAVEIQQVILNLIRNAIDAMMEIDPADRVLTVCTQRSSAETVEVIVRDAGPGVAAENAEQVFQAFFSSKSDGLGMGLAISRSIVESSGGHIWLGTDAMPGAEFHFDLPIAEGDFTDERYAYRVPR